MALLAIVVFFLGSLSQETFEVSLLQTRYPVVHDQGPKKDPVVTLEAERPNDWVTLKQVSRVAVGAILVSEDWAFFDHEGVDWDQLKDAVEKSWHKKRLIRGASTITQQVAKNVLLSREKTISRKVRELILAYRLESVLGKKKILEIYLNIAEWGPGIYGIAQASRTYFHKPPSALTAKEGAFLAMLLPNPKKNSQSFRNRALTPFARRILRSILAKMRMAGYISHEERWAQETTYLSFETAPAEARPAAETGSPEESEEYKLDESQDEPSRAGN